MQNVHTLQLAIKYISGCGDWERRGCGAHEHSFLPGDEYVLELDLGDTSQRCDKFYSVSFIATEKHPWMHLSTLV